VGSLKTVKYFIYIEKKRTYFLLCYSFYDFFYSYYDWRKYIAQEVQFNLRRHF